MNPLELDLLFPAFIAGLLVLATHVPLGMKVLARGIIFVDLAVAQIAGLGVIVAGLLGLAENSFALQLVAATSALLGAALLAYAERKLPEVQEACIGLLFVLAASGGILLMSRDVRAGEHLKDLLVGQILWVGNGQLIATALLTAALLALWRVFNDHGARQATLKNENVCLAPDRSPLPNPLPQAGEGANESLREFHVNERLGSLGFYALFALAVTASVQLVGIYLVFASLIVPAIATHRMTRRRMAAAFGIGIAGYALGLLASVQADLPAGAAIVWAMATVGVVVLVWKRAG